VRFPKWLLDSKEEFYTAIRHPEFAVQIRDYLAATGAGYPKNIEDLIARASEVRSLRPNGGGPNPIRWTLFKKEAESGKLDDYRYLSVRDHGLPMVRTVVEGMLAAEKLDAIVYPTSPRRPPLIAQDNPAPDVNSAMNIANLTGFPDLIVPAGFTTDDLPVGISFLGAAFSEPKLLALGYSFEQATRARRRPNHTPMFQNKQIWGPYASAFCPGPGRQLTFLQRFGGAHDCESGGDDGAGHDPLTGLQRRSGCAGKTSNPGQHPERAIHHIVAGAGRYLLAVDEQSA
jgi:amidase